MTSAALCQLQIHYKKINYTPLNITEQYELKEFTELLGYLPSGHIPLKQWNTPTKIIHVSPVDDGPL